MELDSGALFQNARELSLNADVEPVGGLPAGPLELPCFSELHSYKMVEIPTFLPRTTITSSPVE